jgi:hypothetical protein
MVYVINSSLGSGFAKRLRRFSSTHLALSIIKITTNSNNQAPATQAFRAMEVVKFPLFGNNCGRRNAYCRSIFQPPKPSSGNRLKGHKAAGSTTEFTHLEGQSKAAYQQILHPLYWAFMLSETRTYSHGPCTKQGAVTYFIPAMYPRPNTHSRLEIPFASTQSQSANT